MPRKPFPECPRCHSPAVHVPWEPDAVLRRRRHLRGLGILWLTSPLWLALGIKLGVVVWAAAIIVYLSVTALISIISYINAHTYRCTACRLRWRA